MSVNELEPGDGAAGPKQQGILEKEPLNAANFEAPQAVSAIHNGALGAEQIITALSELFPLAFVADRTAAHRPLKCGIANDLISLGVLNRAEARALRRYVGRL